VTGDRSLYVGTGHALYRAWPGADGRWRAEGVALAGVGGVRGLVIDPDDPRRWCACTSSHGVLVSDDAGIRWHDANRGIVYKEGWCLSRHAAMGDLWYGAGPTSIFRSADRGDTWTFCESVNGLPDWEDWDAARPPHVSHVRDIAVRDDGLAMAAVEQGWLLRSEDGGRSWANVREGLERDCHSVTFLPGEAETVIATTGRGVFRSEDSGRTFAPSGEGLRHHYMTPLVVHPDRPHLLFTAAAETHPLTWVERPEGANAAFYRSDDAGRSWRRLTGGLPPTLRPAPRCVAGDPGDPDSFYIGLIDGSVWLSEDGGESFGIVVEGLQGWVQHLLVVRR